MMHANGEGMRSPDEGMRSPKVRHVPDVLSLTLSRDLVRSSCAPGFLMRSHVVRPVPDLFGATERYGHVVARNLEAHIVA